VYGKAICLALGAALGCQGASGASRSTQLTTVEVPPPEQAPQLPDPVRIPSGCVAFPAGLGRYRIAPYGVGQKIKVGALVDVERMAGPHDRSSEASDLARVVGGADVNSDTRVDYLLMFGFLVGKDYHGYCGNDGCCVVGLYVMCDAGVAVEMIPAAYRYSLEFADSRTRLGGVIWRDLVEQVRRGSSRSEEDELIKRGEPLIYRVLWRRSPEGYRGAQPPYR
jgi:hypothetical protein